MAITSGAAVFEYGDQTTVISDTSAISDGAFNSGTITSLVQTDQVPLADLVLNVTMAVSVTDGSAINLYRRDLNVDGTNDAPVPDSAYRHTYLGSFVVDAGTASQYLTLSDIPIKAEQEFYIENDTGEATSGTTTLKVTPKTYNTKA